MSSPFYIRLGCVRRVKSYRAIFYFQNEAAAAAPWLHPYHQRAALMMNNLRLSFAEVALPPQGSSAFLGVVFINSIFIKKSLMEDYNYFS